MKSLFAGGNQPLPRHDPPKSEGKSSTPARLPHSSSTLLATRQLLAGPRGARTSDGGSGRKRGALYPFG